MAVDKPISQLNPVGGGDIPLDPNTLVEIAIPDGTQPTGYRSHKVTLTDLASGLAGSGGGPVYIAKDLSTIPIYDSGYQFIPTGKLMADLRRGGKFSGRF